MKGLFVVDSFLYKLNNKRMAVFIDRQMLFIL